MLGRARVMAMARAQRGLQGLLRVPWMESRRLKLQLHYSSQSLMELYSLAEPPEGQLQKRLVLAPK